MGDVTVGLDELAAWVRRCEGESAEWASVTDEALRERYTVMLVVRMLVFSHEPPSTVRRDPMVLDLVARLQPCLDAAYEEAERRGWNPKDLRAAARQVLSPPAGTLIDPVALFRAG